MKSLVAFFLLCSLSYLPLKAQDKSQVNQQLWLEALVDYSFGAKWDFYTDASYRSVYTDNLQYWLVMARPSIKRQMLNWLDVRAGVGAFYTEFDENNATLEIRPWEGFAIGWPSFKRIRFSHLVRFEQRFLYDTSDWSYEYSNRYRYQLSTRIKLSKKKKYKTFFIPVAVEVFLQSNNELNELFRNRARYTLGLGYVINREITLDAKLVAERNRSDALDLNITDLLFRLRFRYNLFSFEEDETKL
jgi:Protein of unknown function (DUF2490)